MKRLLVFLSVFSFFACLFLFLTPHNNQTLAATCAQLLHGGTCQPRMILNTGECYRTASLASNCNASQVCCQFAPDCVADLGGTCSSICSYPLSAGVGCNTTNHEVCCGTAPYCSTAQRRDCTYGCTPTSTGGTCNSAPANPCASTAAAQEACVTDFECSTIIQGTEVAKTGCPTGNICCHATTPAMVCGGTLGESCTSESACTNHGIIQQYKTGCVLGSDMPLCCKFSTSQPPPTDPVGTSSSCTQCPDGYDQFWNCSFRIGDIPADKVCCKKGLPFTEPAYSPLIPCSSAQACNIAGACGAVETSQIKCNGTTCQTAVGSIGTTVNGFINGLFAKILGIVGGIAVLLIIISGYKLMASQGNPEKVQGAKEQLTAAIVGLLFVIFSLVFLQVIGYDILKLPGFGQ